jgi:hypothetical protein
MTDNLFSDTLSLAEVLWVLHERIVLVFGFSLYLSCHLLVFWYACGKVCWKFSFTGIVMKMGSYVRECLI